MSLKINQDKLAKIAEQKAKGVDPKAALKIAMYQKRKRK